MDHSPLGRRGSTSLKSKINNQAVKSKITLLIMMCTTKMPRNHQSHILAVSNLCIK